MIVKEEPPLKRFWLQITTDSRLKLIKKETTYILKKLFFWVSSNLKEDPKIYYRFIFLLFIALVPWLSDLSFNRETNQYLARYIGPLDPIKAGELAETINRYTPVIDEKADDVALSMAAESESLTLSQQLAINDTRDIQEPERQSATYTVQKGETVTQIAQKFDLHVASILEANDFKPEELKKITPGMTINIPSSDTSTSDDWLVAINRAELEEKKALEAARQAELRKKQLALANSRSTSTRERTSSGYTGVTSGSFVRPIGGNGISQRFGRGHTGVDFMANPGTPIVAAASGRIIKISTGWSGGYGNMILIDHGGGRATRYAHLSSFNASAGSYVEQGQVIGYSGNTGRSTGPHLHYEVIINGSPVNPGY